MESTTNSEVIRLRDFEALKKLGVALDWYRAVQEDEDNRYFFDFGPMRKWSQYDTKQDASYFGIWVNLPERMIFTYCEGDMTLEICSDDQALRTKLQSMAEFYGPPPPFAVAFAVDGTKTAYYDSRPQVD